MNLPQRIILALGAVASAAMALFPPWAFVFKYPERSPIERFAGYHPLWQPNNPSDITALSSLFGVTGRMANLSFFSIRIDTTRLTIQIATVLLVTLLLTALCRPARQD